MKTTIKMIFILFGLLSIISCKNDKKERKLEKLKNERVAETQLTYVDTIFAKNYHLIFLRPNEKEFNRLLEVHGEDSGLYEVDSDFGFYASKVNDSLSSADLKIEFKTERIIAMDSDNGMVYIDREEIENGAYGILFNHTNCFPTIEFGVMTDLEIYQRMADQKENCR